jgi:hypothetical protein
MYDEKFRRATGNPIFGTEKNNSVRETQFSKFQREKIFIIKMEKRNHHREKWKYRSLEQHQISILHTPRLAAAMAMTGRRKRRRTRGESAAAY